MGKLFDMLDIAPDWKTNVTAVLTALFAVLSATGVWEIPEEVKGEIIMGVIALVSLFLSLKFRRLKKLVVDDDGGK